MAVIQISKMQVRRGQTEQTGIPQLSSGEFGWSIDTQELYIGNGSVMEGAPAVGNTRILTEHDNFFNAINAPYIYRNQDYISSFIDAPVITGPDNTEIIRKIQDKLDEFVTLHDFGAVGDGITDDTVAIQRALDQLYRNSDKYQPNSRKPLYFPSGNFLISSTIYIPPYAEIRGAGKNKTFITNLSTSTIFQTVDSLGNKIDDPITSGENSPKDVRIEKITFVSTLESTESILRIDSLQDGIIENCIFTGPEDIISSDYINYPAGIELRTQGSPTTNNIHIRDCIFKNLSIGIKSNYDVTDITISSNKFINLNQGLVFGQNLLNVPGSLIGPTYVLIDTNYFNSINYQAISVGSDFGVTKLTYVDSHNNSFINVGNNNSPLGELDQASEIINFSVIGAASTNDSFDRLLQLNLQDINNFQNPIKSIVSGPVKMQIQFAGLNRLLSTSSSSLVSVPRSYYYYNNQIIYTPQKLEIEYKFYRLDQPSLPVIRSGIITVEVKPSQDPIIVDSFIADNEDSSPIKFLALENQSLKYTTISYNNPTSTSFQIFYTLKITQ